MGASQLPEELLGEDAAVSQPMTRRPPLYPPPPLPPPNREKLYWTLGVLALLICSFVYSSWYFGMTARSQIDQLLEARGIDGTLASIGDWEAGVFRSSQTITWDVGPEQTLRLYSEIFHYPAFDNASLRVFHGETYLILNEDRIGRLLIDHYINDDQTMRIDFIDSVANDSGVLPISFPNGAKLRYRNSAELGKSQVDLTIPLVNIELPKLLLRISNLRVRGAMNSFSKEAFDQNVYVTFDSLDTNQTFPHYGSLRLKRSKLDLNLKMQPEKLWDQLRHFDRILTIEQVNSIKPLLQGDANILLRAPEGAIKLHLKSDAERFQVTISMAQSFIETYFLRHQQLRIRQMIRSKQLSTDGTHVTADVEVYKGQIYVGGKPLTPFRIP